MPLIDQVTQPAKRSRANPRQILRSYVDRIKQLPDYRSNNVIISDQPVPQTLNPLGKYGVTVSMQDGDFNRSLFNGAGHQQLATRTRIIVAVFVRNARDKIGMKDSAFMDDRGILDRFHDILKCLLVADPKKGELSQQWEPTGDTRDTKGIPLLRSLPVPMGFTDPSEIDGHAGWLGMLLTFEIEFDWDLYG